MTNSTNNATADIADDLNITSTPTNVPAPTTTNASVAVGAEVFESDLDVDVEVDMVPSDFTINGNISAPPADNLQYTQTTTIAPVNMTMNATMNDPYVVRDASSSAFDLKGTRDLHNMEKT